MAAKGIFKGRSLRVLPATLPVVFRSMALTAPPLGDIHVEVEGPDGTVLQLLASEDGFHNWVHVKGSFTVVGNPNTGYAEHTVLKNGELLPSVYAAGKADPASVGLQPGGWHTSSSTTDRAGVGSTRLGCVPRASKGPGSDGDSLAGVRAAV